MNSFEVKSSDHILKNTSCIAVANYLLTFNNFPISLFNSLKSEEKKTIILFMIKRGFVNSKVELEEILRNTLNNTNNIFLKSDCNYFSLMDTVLNKILRKCFDYYMSKLDERKLTQFISRSKNSIRSANKIFWYLFFTDFQTQIINYENIIYDLQNV